MEGEEGWDKTVSGGADSNAARGEMRAHFLDEALAILMRYLCPPIRRLHVLPLLTGFASDVIFEKEILFLAFASPRSFTSHNSTSTNNACVYSIPLSLWPPFSPLSPLFLPLSCLASAPLVASFPRGALTDSLTLARPRPH